MGWGQYKVGSGFVTRVPGCAFGGVPPKFGSHHTYVTHSPLGSF